MNNSPRFLKWVLAIAILVVLNLFFNYSIHLVYPAPEWNDFCPDQQVNKLLTEAECVGTGGSWTETPPLTPGVDIARPVPTQVQTGYCDPTFICRQAFEDANKLYNRNVFLILVVLGLASIIVSFWITAQAVSYGLSLGGVLSFIIGSMRYWSEMQDYLQVILLALALAVLIWLGVKKLKE